LFEATLAIIGSKLINTHEKVTMQMLFKIMDESGDGHLGEEELVRGYYKVLGRHLTEEEATSILTRVVEDKGHIDYQDWLISSINYKSKEAFMGYMKSAYVQFFDNEFESVDT